MQSASDKKLDPKLSLIQGGLPIKKFRLKHESLWARSKHSE